MQKAVPQNKFHFIFDVHPLHAPFSVEPGISRVGMLTMLVGFLSFLFSESFSLSGTFAVNMSKEEGKHPYCFDSEWGS